MSATLERNLTTPTFATLVQVGSLPVIKATDRKGGAEIRVEVKTNPSGRLGIDVRRYATPARTVKGSGYAGPTAKGLWLSTVEAELVAELLAQAVVAAESVDIDEEGCIA